MTMLNIYFANKSVSIPMTVEVVEDFTKFLSDNDKRKYFTTYTTDENGRNIATHIMRDSIQYFTETYEVE